MIQLTDQDYELANERGRIEFETKPHAKSARFDRVSGMLVLELYNGCIFSVPARQLQGLEGAADKDIETVELTGFGYGVHWEAFDADFTVHGLMAGWFGNTAHMAPLRAELRALLERAVGDRRDAA